MLTRPVLIAGIALGIIIAAAPAYAQGKSILVASTTSTEDSGLFGFILPLFKQSRCNHTKASDWG